MPERLVEHDPASPRGEEYHRRGDSVANPPLSESTDDLKPRGRNSDLFGRARPKRQGHAAEMAFDRLTPPRLEVTSFETVLVGCPF